MMDRYWSPVQEFRNSPLPTVALMSERDRLMRDVMAWVIVPSIPVPIMAPPNIMAESTRYMVGSIPSMPDVDTSGSSRVLPVDMSVDVQSTLSEVAKVE